MPYQSIPKLLAHLGPIFVAVSTLALGAEPSNPVAGDVSSLFQDAKTTADQLKRDVVEMESYARSALSWRSHAVQITRIKDHINKAGQLAAQLEKSRNNAQPWHETAIDRLTPLLKELASNTSAMIERINQQKSMNDPAYNAFLKSNEDLATELSKLISDTVDYDKTKTELQKLDGKS
jgi:hypothetical protein